MPGGVRIIKCGCAADKIRYVLDPRAEPHKRCVGNTNHKIVMKKLLYDL